LGGFCLDDPEEEPSMSEKNRPFAGAGEMLLELVLLLLMLPRAPEEELRTTARDESDERVVEVE
jgi:hypothetical protein